MKIYERLGAHLRDGGTQFSVWAPNAERVEVIGDFNAWKGSQMRGSDSGVWTAFVPAAQEGALYKYRVVSRERGYTVEKADPLAFFAEVAPKQASIVRALDYAWNDHAWMKARDGGAKRAMSIYEVHLGSWQRSSDRPEGFLGYRELAPLLGNYCRDMGFTHVELLPIMEHPFYGSWGYQSTGYFAPTSRYGTPQDFMAFVDHLHGLGIGVILDWVPSHFPMDAHGLAFFDGTHLYEHQDPREGFHQDWKSAIFNYGRHEVREFLIGSALFWLDKYHIDGLRVDAVASMLYRDYSRKAGEWIPNRFGGRENLEAIAFLKELNETVYREHPSCFTVAEESTAWPMVSRPTYVGGLGFGFKWDMGWMHDTLSYLQQDPIHRSHHHGKLTFRRIYATSEHFVLSLSHDEVVHGKGSLLNKMPGDAWQKFANLRVLYGYMYAQSGKKLIFMGGEFGQWREWSHDRSLDWHVFDEDPKHDGLKRWLVDLNGFYRDTPALFERDDEDGGFQWVDCCDTANSVMSFLRHDGQGRNVLAVFNFTPVPRHHYRVGVPQEGRWLERLNSDAPLYGGSGQGNLGGVETRPVAAHGQPCSLSLTLPPLSVLFLQCPT